MRAPLFPFLIFVLSALTFTGLKSQVAVSGKVLDDKGEGIPGVTVKALRNDSALAAAAMTDIDGLYSLSLPENSKFIISFSYFGYSGRSQFQNIETGTTPLKVRNVVLKETRLSLKEVEIKGLQNRGEQRGDSTIFNADAFKTNPDATAEDLIKKMPGVTSDNNGVKVHGENVQRVLVDGKPFFGDDANAALKNLPAEIIEKVEIFDKLSDQAQFSGVNDGETQKTINLVTKKNKNVGTFGKVAGGYGADENFNSRYAAGAAINNFNGVRRVALLLLSNNINQQNFSTADITGAMGSSGGNQRGGRGRQSGGSSLMVPTQNGITTTQSGGLNFSDEWGKKLTVTGSYFFNHSDNRNQSDIVREYFNENKLRYTQTNSDKGLNLNHRFNSRIEYSPDSANKFIFTPSVSFQDHKALSTLMATNSENNEGLLSTTSTQSEIDNAGYDVNLPLLMQHRFRKRGRTVSLNLQLNQNERFNDGSYNSENSFGDTTNTSLDQLFNKYGYNKEYSADLSYTEPLGKNGVLQMVYNPSYNEGMLDRKTSDFNELTNEYSNFNPSLSNKYTNIYETQRVGFRYRYRTEKIMFNLGSNFQESRLSGDQEFPVLFRIDYIFRNVLPNAMFNYRFSKTKNFRIYYRSRTNIPSLTQLQNVIDVSNPLQVSSGNPDLKQTFDNYVSLRFGGFNPATERNAMIYVNLNHSNNYISNASYILETDTVLQGFTVKAGSQLTKPVNLDGYYNLRTFMVYGFPVTRIKSNVNFNGGLNYGHTPSLINRQINVSNSYAGNAGIFIGSNISENLDFSIGYTGNYTVVKNTLQVQSDNSYFNHGANFKINWIFFKGLVINTDITHTLFNGLSQSFNQNFALWNGYIGYKFLKNKSLEAKVSVFDILNQNRSIGRIITGAYTEDYNTMVLRRYVMFSVTYTFRKFRSGAPPPVEEEGKDDRPPGMRRGR